MANTLLMRKEDSYFLKLCASHPQHESLFAIVVHTAAVMFDRLDAPLLWPLVTMLTNPGALKVVHMLLHWMLIILHHMHVECLLTYHA